MGAYPRGTAVHSSGAEAPRLSSPSLGGTSSSETYPDRLGFFSEDGGSTFRKAGALAGASHAPQMGQFLARLKAVVYNYE